MARELLNTLYVTTQGSYLRLDNQTIRVESESRTLLRVPLHHLGAIVCFGRVSLSTAAIARCAEDQRDVVFLSRSGRFRAKVVGPTSGNVLLRLAQYRAYENPSATLEIARNIVASKLQNGRMLLMREARQTKIPESEVALRSAAGDIADTIKRLLKAACLDDVRGHEGFAAAAYFSSFDCLIRSDDEDFRFNGRNRRPPRDPINATLSFLYALIRSECQAACEGVGLDPQIGFLHSVRPGRPSLALDLMEELRSYLADRLALTLINRRQLTSKHFEKGLGGSVSLNEDGRKNVLVAYQQRKADEIRHPIVQQRTPIGLIPHLQARLLARHLRGDLEHYPAFVAK